MNFLLLLADDKPASNLRVRQARVLAQSLHLELVIKHEHAPSVLSPTQPKNIAHPSINEWTEAVDREGAKGICLLQPRQFDQLGILKREFPSFSFLVSEDPSSLLLPLKWLVLAEREAGLGRISLPDAPLHALDSLQKYEGYVQQRGEGWLRMEIIESSHRSSLSRFHFPEENLLPILNKYTMEKGIAGMSIPWQQRHCMEKLFSNPGARYYRYLSTLNIWLS